MRLEKLSSMLKRLMHQLIKTVIRNYHSRRSRYVENDLEEALGLLRAHRARDPNFKEVISASARAEALFSERDPVEGTVVAGELIDGKLVEGDGSVP